MKPLCLQGFTWLALAVAAVPVEAQTWPTRPIRAIVPIAAGSLTDIVPRLVLEQLSTQLGQRIVVENRPGAGSTLGTAAAAKAAPDGYTVLVNSSAHTVAPSLYANLDYDPARDFVAVAPLGVSPFVLVAPPARGFRTAGELVAAAKAKPGTFNFSSPGIGTASHLSAERFRLSAGVQASHVPFKGGSEALTEVMTGRVDFFFVALGAALPLIQEGAVTALAVNDVKRSAALPDVPTTAEAGFANAEYPTWFGLFVPARTPREIIDRLQRETVMALQAPNVQEKLRTIGVDPAPMVPGAFGAYVEKQIAADAALVALTKIKAE
ncbi:hypothetical protein OPKNFCMD_5829 [Methylobacterium crusticola]|uniref:Tripartite tricarboxylate transporter substrate binding protein n=1 Tax=Methylobacterium crusticola TaxID=1697972 RepID=A0ABQ4R5X8_9HYPH|nr:tripartite tricarboxylate transporter substrate binding protein [Methylobacterium crusticola]GJD53058.1 hypothetical protein OPKNFCMD_5829 [Methylobacterium crusticola]